MTRRAILAVCSEQAKSVGLDFAIAGRAEPKVKDLRLNVPYYVFDLNHNAILDSVLKDAVVILNYAGPYIRTAKTLMEGYIRNGMHYLDISAEIECYQQAQQYRKRVRISRVLGYPVSLKLVNINGLR